MHGKHSEPGRVRLSGLTDTSVYRPIAASHVFPKHQPLFANPWVCKHTPHAVCGAALAVGEGGAPRA